MKRLLVAWLLFLPWGVVTGEELAAPAPGPGVYKATLEPLKAGKNKYHLEESLQIRLEVPAGVAPLTIADSKALGVYLVMDNVVMTSLGNPVVETPATGSGMMLSFLVTRDAEKEPSREQWAQLLEQQEGGVSMNFPLAITIDSRPGIPVQTPADFDFSITTRGKLWGTLVVGLLVFGWIYRRLLLSPTALRDSPGGFYSLGKSQMAFWGLLVPLAFFGIFVNTGNLEYIPDGVLTLMGISGATGLAAAVIGNPKSRSEGAAPSIDDAGEPAKTETPKSKLLTQFFWDLCDDGDGVSIHRMQAVLWTLFLGIVFVYQVVQVIAMPVFSTTLLLMMGISNSTYLGLKTQE